MQEYPCLICQSDAYDRVYTLRRDPYLERLGLDNGRVSKVMCRDCGLVYSRPQLEEAELKRLYEGLRDTDTPTEDYLWWKKQMASEDFEWVAPYLPSSGSVLDIGCSEGSFLRHFQQRGWRTCGIEPSHFARFGRMQYGLDIREEIFEETRLPERTFDLIVALRTLEHIGNPRVFLSRVDSLLKEEGLLYLEVPNMWKPRHPLGEFIGAQHLRLFSKETFLLFLAQMGFESIGVDDSHNGLRALCKRGPKRDLLPKCLSHDRQRQVKRLRYTWRRYSLKWFWTATAKMKLREWMDRCLGPTSARRSVAGVKRLLHIDKERIGRNVHHGR